MARAFRLGQADANTVLGVAALLTSAVAVVVAWDESRVLRQAYRTAFTPIVEVRAGLVFSEDEPSVFAVDLRNVGPGVARIEGAAIRHGGEALDGYAGFMEAMFTPYLTREASLATEPTLGYLKAEEARRALSLTWDTFQGTRGQVRDYAGGEYAGRLDRFDFVVCYCSLFDECWEAHANRAAPGEVASCEGTDDPTVALDRSSRGGGA